MEIDVFRRYFDILAIIDRQKNSISHNKKLVDQIFEKKTHNSLKSEDEKSLFDYYNQNSAAQTKIIEMQKELEPVEIQIISFLKFLGPNHPFIYTDEKDVDWGMRFVLVNENFEVHAVQI